MPKLQAKPYQVVNLDGKIVGTVHARNSLNAAAQARQMFGPTVIVGKVYQTPSAQAKTVKAAVAAFNDWTAGKKAALTKAFAADFAALDVEAA